jgi:hypothetical protein
MSKPREQDTDKQRGWLVRVKTLPSLDRLLYVYELDWAKAKELANAKAPVANGASVEAVGTVNVHSTSAFAVSCCENSQSSLVNIIWLRQWWLQLTANATIHPEHRPFEGKGAKAQSGLFLRGSCRIHDRELAWMPLVDHAYAPPYRP